MTHHPYLKKLAADPAALALALHFGLPALQARFLAVLAREGEVSSAAMLAALYPERTAPPDPAILKVVVCQLRQALAAESLDIETIHGKGWRLNELDLAHLRALAGLSAAPAQGRAA